MILTRRAVGAILLAAGGAAAVARAPALAEPRQAMTAEAAHRAAAGGEIILVDVRRPDELAATGLPAHAVALDMRRPDFRARLDALIAERPGAAVALICARGGRSAFAQSRLAAEGVASIDVSEGMLGGAAGPGWLARGLPLRRPARAASALD